MRLLVLFTQLGLLTITLGCSSSTKDQNEDGGAVAAGGTGSGAGGGPQYNVTEVRPLGGGTSLGSSGSAGGAANVCNRFTLQANSIPPRVLFVQDLSSSMISQWEPLDSTMVALASQFGSRLQLGLVPFSSVYLDNVAQIKADTESQFDAFFAKHDDDCDISDSSVVMPAPDNAAKIIATYDSIVASRMVGGTPTYAAIEKTKQLLVDSSPNDGSAAYAILVTDGEPNCPSPTSDNIADVTTAISELASAGVNTYVVGYNYTGSALDTWARVGKTQSYYNASDSSKLMTAISSILVSILPCEFTLSGAVADARYVRVTVDAKDRALGNDANGWVLESDQKTITLTGQACSDLRSDGNHTIDVVVECEQVVIVN